LFYFSNAKGEGEVEEEEGTALGPSSKMTGKELENLLKQGAYAVLGEDGAEKSQTFHQLDIETILENSTREIVYNPEGSSNNNNNNDNDDGSSSSSSGGGGGGGGDKKTGAVVSMQSFTSAGADTSLSVDDDDFWSKLMPGMKSARGLMSRLNDGAATRDEESKAMFMHELSELVKDVLEAKSNQEDVSSHEWDTTKQMVLQTSCMKSSFSEEECDQASAWLESMEGYEGRRNRGARMSTMGNNRNKRGG